MISSPAAPTTAEVLAAGREALLTTTGPRGPRTRPVILQADPLGRPDHVSILTSVATRKVADLRADARVTLAGPTPPPHRGWFSVPAVAVVTRADEAGPRVVRLDLAVSDGRLWTVRSDAPFDNETSVLAVPR